ncbi:MAG: PfkB family carbohydrate kinase [Bacteroidota bacterium]
MGKKIIAVGEVLWDVLPEGSVVLGGTPTNLIFRSNSFGETGHLLSRIGDDKSGKEIIKRLNELGISDENIQIDSEFPTGTVNVTFNRNGDLIFELEQDVVAFDHIEFSPEALKLARGADLLFFGLLPQRFGISKNTIKELIKESPESLHFFDLKLFKQFFNKKVVKILLKYANIVRIKETDILFLAKELAIDTDSLEDFGMLLSNKFNIDIVIITRGYKGVLAISKKEETLSVPGYLINAEDDIGSGMAFSAGFLHYYLNGKSIIESLHFGNAAGALNTTRIGGTEYFSKQDVLDFMEKIPQRL